MQWQPFWIRKWVPELTRALVSQPIAELRPEPLSEYVHGTFFYTPNRHFILVQVLNALELATEGEYRGIGKVEISVHDNRLKVKGARTMWPKQEDLEVRNHGDRARVTLANPSRYTALLLKIEPGLPQV